MRLFATSDLHTDYRENFRWLQELSDTEYRDDVLIVAGDVSDRMERYLAWYDKYVKKNATPSSTSTAQ